MAVCGGNDYDDGHWGGKFLSNKFGVLIPIIDGKGPTTEKPNNRQKGKKERIRK